MRWVVLGKLPLGWSGWREFICRQNQLRHAVRESGTWKQSKTWEQDNEWDTGTGQCNRVGLQ